MTHPELVSALKKPGEAILTSLDPAKAELLHYALLLCSEAGELADAIKKHVIYNKPLDHENVLEEAGDIHWALEAIGQVLGFTQEEAKAGNVEKLSKRYSAGVYSDQQAQERRDKAASDSAHAPMMAIWKNDQ